LQFERQGGAVAFRERTLQEAANQLASDRNEVVFFGVFVRRRFFGERFFKLRDAGFGELVESDANFVRRVRRRETERRVRF
jgi:hypothetical protein